MTTAVLDGRELAVAVAHMPSERSIGLMFVDGLGSLDGLVFAYDEPVQGRFHMRNVRFPLDIAFIDEAGAVLAVVAMPLCDADPCPAYGSPAPVAWALETPAGALRDVQAGDRFELRTYGQGPPG